MCTVLEIDGPRCNMDIQSHSKAQLRQQFLRHLAETGFANAEAGEDGERPGQTSNHIGHITKNEPYNYVYY